MNIHPLSITGTPTDYMLG